MKSTVKAWWILISAHLFLAVVPFLLIENKLTAFIPYHSIFIPLELAAYAGLPVYGQVSKDMFMAPITVLGWCMVAALWLTIHFGLAAVLSRLTRHTTTEPTAHSSMHEK